MIHRQLAIGAALATTLFFSSREARAQANYRLAPVGGRATLVGGTGLVYGRDSSSAFLNPATVVRVDPGHLSFSANFYEISLFSSKNWYAPGAVDQAHFPGVTDNGNGARVSTQGFDSLPGSLCVFLRVGELFFLNKFDKKQLGESQARLGICLASVSYDDFALNNEDYNQPNPNGSSRQAQTVRQSFRKIAVGPTYAMYVSRALALGASLHISHTGYRSIFETSSVASAPGGGSINQGFYNSAHGDSWDIAATVGATYRVGSHQTLALALEAPSIHAFGPGGYNSYVHYDGSGSATSSTDAAGTFAVHSPMRFALGTGIRESWGTFELNTSYHIPLASAYHAHFSGRALDVDSAGAQNERGNDLDLSARAKGAMNIGVGAEVFVAPYISLLTGASTDLSTVRGGKLANDQLAYFASDMSRVSGSLGVGSHGTGGSLLLGGEVSYSWGNRLAVNSYQLPARLDAVAAHNVSIVLVIAGTTSIQAIKRAVNDLGNAVDLVPLVPKDPNPPNKTPTEEAEDAKKKEDKKDLKEQKNEAKPPKKQTPKKPPAKPEGPPKPDDGPAPRVKGPADSDG